MWFWHAWGKGVSSNVWLTSTCLCKGSNFCHSVIDIFTKQGLTNQHASDIKISVFKVDVHSWVHWHLRKTGVASHACVKWTPSGPPMRTPQDFDSLLYRKLCFHMIFHHIFYLYLSFNFTFCLQCWPIIIRTNVQSSYCNSATITASASWRSLQDLSISHCGTQVT